MLRSVPRGQFKICTSWIQMLNWLFPMPP